jgi:hypothetical protein
MKLKVEHFQVYDLVTVCFDNAIKILALLEICFHLHSKWFILRHFKVVYKCMKKKVS